MKHSYFFLPILLMAVVSCNPQRSTYVRTTQGAPIIPIRVNGDGLKVNGEGGTMTIYKTDYVPLLATDVNETVTLPMTDTLSEWYVPCGNRPADKSSCCVAILPRKPLRTGMYIRQADKGEVVVAFTAGTPAIERLHAYVQNFRIRAEKIQRNEDGTFTIPIAPKMNGRTYLRIYAETATELMNDILMPLEDGIPVTQAAQLTRHDDQAQVLYSLMIDRFYNGNTANDRKLNSPEVLDIVDYQGGDLKGITQKIESGFFDELGVNTLWISPITQNPWDAWGYYPFEPLEKDADGTQLYNNKYDKTKAYTRFSGYHGYWPIYATKTDDRFGTGEELAELLTTAHQHNMNVVLDYVANHMHINSPTLQEHPDWHTDSLLPDGRRNFELWDEARLTTWFDKHIPTLDLERPEVCECMTDSALYWLEHYELDGFRHDACKHIPEGYWRLLEQKIARRFPGRHIWMIGETYGSPQLIGSYVKTGMLNAQFDFNLYWTLRNALINGDSFETINATVLESMAAYGSHHTMGCISGNHDQIRFASLADGAIRDGDDKNGGKETGWTRDVRPATELAYTRAMQLEVLNMTLPGVPCIYQGDEYAEIGANDPDNRHMMRFEGLNEQEEAFRQKVKTMIDLRRHSMALTYGEYIPVEVSHDTLVFDRVYLNETVRVKIIRDGISEIETYIEPLSR